MNDYPLLLKHNIIGSKTNPTLKPWEKSSESDAGCIMTFLVDRMAMADEKGDDGEGQMWNTIQNVEEFRTSFDNIHFIDEINRIGKILNTTVSVDEVDDMISEALCFVEKEFNSDQQAQGINMLMSMAMADGDLDDRELDLLFEYGKVTQDHNARIEFLNFLAQHCEGQGISFSEEKIKSLINKVNNPEPEPKKETSAKQMVALPDGTSADIMDTSHWNIGAFQLHYEEGEEDGAYEYLESLRKMITILENESIVLLQDADLFLEKTKNDCIEDDYEIIDRYLFFAFPGKAEKCAEIMRVKSGDAQYYGAINFYDMFEERFWYQNVDHGDWETGWIESGNDEDYYRDWFENEITDEIKNNFNIFKTKGIDALNKTIDQTKIELTDNLQDDSKIESETSDSKEEKIPAWKKIKTAMESFGPLYAADYVEIMDYCNEHFGEVKKSTFRTYIISCTVNHSSRVHYSPNKKERTELLDNDVLYQVEEGMVTLYDPEKHGQWHIKKDSDGKLRISKS